MLSCLARCDVKFNPKTEKRRLSPNLFFDNIKNELVADNKAKNYAFFKRWGGVMQKFMTFGQPLLGE
jgi:hypothetical protein